MNAIKALLVRLGSLCSERIVQVLGSALNYLEVGRWMNAKGFAVPSCVRTREELFRQLARRIADEHVLYLEFGVAGGDSLRYWSGLLKNPACCLHGFDTFEGLPFDWKRHAKKGAFSTGGKFPQIRDRRVKFFKGLFQETLPGYVPPDYEILVIGIDCDLYSSAYFVLNALSEYIHAGTYIYFDEFSDASNELRAFNDFMTATGKRFRVIGADRTYSHVIFECTAADPYSSQRNTPFSSERQPRSGSNSLRALPGARAGAT